MTVTVKLNTDRKPLSGLYPIVIQLIIDRRRALIYIGVKVHFEEFDAVKKHVRYIKGVSRSCKEVTEQNRHIRCVMEEVKAQLAEFVQKGVAFTAKDIASCYRLRTSQDTLYGLFEKMIREKYACGKIGGAKAYESTYSKIRALTDGNDIRIKCLHPVHIEDLYRKMSRPEISLNTVSFYMRNLRAVLNSSYVSVQAGKKISRKLFADIVLRRERTIKRALSTADMNALVSFKTGTEPEMDFVRDLFLLCFLLRGVALVDIFFMERECLQNGYIYCRRRKTSVQLSVALTEESRPLVERYLSHDARSPYLFCFLDGYNDAIAAYNAYRTALKKQNTTLKILGQKLGLSVPLTSYCARHTWATQAKSVGASLEHISEALGHTSPKTTVIYLKSFSQEVLDGLNNKVIASYGSAIRNLYNGPIF